LIFILVAVAFIGVSCKQEQIAQKPQVNGEGKYTQELVEDNGPQLLDEEPPLLLEEGPDINQLDELGADNSRCFVCHINYIQEDIAVTHARANIGCADCHGESDEHIADESWAWGGKGTPPDIMYPRAQINTFCMGCHTRDKIDTEQHKPLSAIISAEKFCTDCHGNHRLSERKCKWK